MSPVCFVKHVPSTLSLSPPYGLEGRLRVPILCVKPTCRKQRAHSPVLMASVRRRTCLWRFDSREDKRNVLIQPRPSRQPQALALRPLGRRTHRERCRQPVCRLRAHHRLGRDSSNLFAYGGDSAYWFDGGWWRIHHRLCESLLHIVPRQQSSLSLLLTLILLGVPYLWLQLYTQRMRYAERQTWLAYLDFPHAMAGPWQLNWATTPWVSLLVIWMLTALVLGVTVALW